MLGPSCSLRTSAEPPCVWSRPCNAIEMGNKHRYQWLQPTTLTCVATALTRSRSRAILRGKLLISNPPVLICDPRAPSVVGTWYRCRVSPIGPYQFRDLSRAVLAFGVPARLLTDVDGLTSRALRRYRFVEGFLMSLQETQHRGVRRVREV